MLEFQHHRIDTQIITKVEKEGENLNESEKQTTEDLNEKQSEISLTVKEAAIHIEETPYVIRNWMRELKGHIPTTQGDNGYHYFDHKSIERLLLIKELKRDRGYSLKQIEFYLSTGENPKPEKPPEDQTLKELKLIRDQLQLQEEFNKALIQRLDSQQSYIEKSITLQSDIKESITKRDQNLLESLRQSQQAQLQAAVATEKKGFIRKLFSVLFFKNLK